VSLKASLRLRLIILQLATTSAHEIHFYSPEGEYCKYSVGQKNGLHAFGYNLHF